MSIKHRHGGVDWPSADDCPRCWEEACDVIQGELNKARLEVERLQAGGCARDQNTTQYCAEAAEAKREAAQWQELSRENSVRATEAEAREDRLRAELDAALKESDALRCGVDKADIKVMRLCDILTDIVKQYDIATGEHCYTSAPVRYHIERGRKELAKAY